MIRGKCYNSRRGPSYFFNLRMWLNPHVFYLSFYISLVNSVSNDLGEVVFVSILFRHGDRTPIEPYPNDPYKNNSLWPVGWGELTNIGKEGHYELGKWLRHRYKDLLPDSYNKDDIYIRSTDVDRTLMSAYSNLAGLYEPNMKSNWNPLIKWTPIPVHTVPENLDWVVAGKAPCLKYDIEMKKVQNSPAFQKMNEENKKLYDYLSKYTGSNITGVEDVERIYDSLYIEELFKYPLPKWTKPVYPQPMKKISEFTFTIPCYTRTLARLKVGPLIGEILTHMQEKISGVMKLNRKAWMYSGHDTTIANVLNGLHLFQPHCPPYLSLILFELRKKNQDYFVAIHYRNSSSIPPYFMQLKGCDKLCPFEKFVEIVSPLIPGDWKEECQAIQFAKNIYDTTASISFITVLSLALLFLLTFTVIIKLYKNQRWSQAEFAYKSLKVEITS